MTRRLVLCLGATILFAALLAGAPASAGPSPELALTAGNEADLRAHLITASGDNSGPHTITLTADITITGGTDPSYGGTQPLTIDGQGQFALDGGGTRRVLSGPGASQPLLTLQDLTIRNGFSTTRGGGVSWGGPVTIDGVTMEDNAVEATATVFGGALATSGDIVVTRSRFIGNALRTSTGNANGGALSTSFQVTASDSVFRDNIAETLASGSAAGGALHAGPGTVTIENSVVQGNRAEGPGTAGGGIVGGGVIARGSSVTDNTARTTGAGSTSGGGLSSTFGDIEVTDSTVGRNGASSSTGAAVVRGAGVYAGGTISLRNSTVADNSLETSGFTEAAVRGQGDISLTHVTIAGNDPGGGISGLKTGAALTSEASVVTGPTASCSVASGTTSNGYNYDTSGTCGFGAGTGDVDVGTDHS